MNAEQLMDRIATYKFECEAGPLHLCVDYQKLCALALVADTTAPDIAKEPRNQCDGCARGLPINANGNHVEDKFRPVMACTADRYTATTVPEVSKEPWIAAPMAVGETRYFTGQSGITPQTMCAGVVPTTSDTRAKALEEAAKICDDTGPDDWTSQNCAFKIRAAITGKP